MQQPQDDRLVIQMILQGNPNAYAVIVDRYQAYVFTLVMRYVNDRELAEELAQDVFVKAYRCLADFRGTSKFSTWLYTIVHTTCLSHVRRKNDMPLLPGHEAMLSISDASQQQAPHVIDQKDRRQLLTNAIAALPQDDAQVLTLFYLAEQSLEEIGRIMGITANNVKIKLYRARQKLRGVLETKFNQETV